MQLAKTLETEILKVYGTYFDSYMNGDIETVAALLDDEYTQIGSAESEVFFNKEDAVQFLRDTIHQVAGNLEMRNRVVKLDQQNDVFLVHELADLYALAGDEWIFYAKFRASTFMQKRNGAWKIIHQHSSFPDTKTEEGQNIAVDKIAEENLQLREAVKRRTIELEQKNRDLEIETSLERVRAVAMGMKQPADMLDICRVITDQLLQLSIKEIRNVQTAIIDESKGTYQNFEYYKLHDKTIITEVDYHHHEMTTAFVKQMLNGPEEIFSQSLTGKELRNWFEHQKTTNQFIDSYLETASSLNYYWYSIGAVALGVSTYAPLNEAEIELLKRFRNVFELAYRRFMDIEKAEVQAKEAKIELALERVRARTMAMRQSAELADTASVLFQQVKKFGIDTWVCGFCIRTNDDFVETWVGADSGELLPLMRLPYKHVQESGETGQRTEDFSTETAGGEELVEHYRYMRALPGAEKVFDAIINAGHPLPTFQVTHRAYFSHGFLLFITYEAVPAAHELFKRFANVFDQTYTRFLDLQNAEAQAKESQIQLAMERVRARTMAMQHSNELADTASILFQQIKDLGFNMWSCGFCIWEKDDLVEAWLNADSGGLLPPMMIPYKEEPTHRKIYESSLRGDILHEAIWEGGALQKHYEFLQTIPSVKEAIDILNKSGLSLPSKQCYYAGFFKQGYLLLITKEPTANAGDLTKRFARVFEQTYTRFLDLQKAEAQAREAQIEAALERVRSKTMAMHRSSELLSVINVLSEQFLLLGFNIHSANFNTSYKEKDWNLWLYTPGYPLYPDQIHIPYFDHPYFNRTSASLAKGQDFNTEVFSKKDKDTFLDHLYANTIAKNAPVDRQKFTYATPGFAWSVVYLKNTAITIANYDAQPYTEEQNLILRRFGNVFEQSYTRFLDLQKTEEQAREAQVELGLERVRARAMAMQKSEELKELIATVFIELTKLELVLARCLIMIYEAESKASTWWMANSEAPADPIGLHIKYHELPPYLAYINAWKRRDIKWRYILAGEDKKEWDNFLFTETELSQLPDLVIEGMKEPTRVYLNSSFNSFGNLTLATLEPLSDEQFDLLLRFAKVFDLTYTRFNDLLKAEAQAREAQIELSLERVRAKTIAMHNSQDVADTAAIMFDEVKKLGIETFRCGIGIMQETNGMEVWVAKPSEQGKAELVVGRLDMMAHPMLYGAYQTWVNKQEIYFYELKGDDLIKYYTVINNQADYPVKYDISQLPSRIMHSEFHFPEGCLFVFSIHDLTVEELKIFKRFSGVFGQTYRRFLDLQKAEANATEARIEASLERVRSKAMSMHSSQDLADTIGLFYHELELFSITPRRCGVGLIDKETHITELSTLNTTEDGKSIEIIGKVKLVGHPVLEGIYDNWLLNNEYHPVLKGNEIKEYHQLLRPQIAFPDYPHDAVHYGYFFYFPEGGVYAWTDKVLADDELKIYRRFTSVLSLTYKRYKDLKISEAHAQQSELDLIQLKEEKKRTEEALTELKETQKQLIQSEKMASLGELTAGIAHEIQNPLNFVNNFSEVSNELIDEMMEEVNKGNFEEVKTIAGDVKQNLEKINHHGKRADGIVKGMLQHSRSSSATKEPTDINKLADEYLRLAYHGLRAKDKTFNATLKTEYDEGIGSINIIPQDIGRVILNLITNAFYVVGEKKQQQQNDYEPTVSVSTKKINDKVEVSVKDNGNGIPLKVLDKIFQPFFTTKPTGQGTGLGLSLAYDIVKAHGGELKVETKEGVGSEFIVQLPIV